MKQPCAKMMVPSTKYFIAQHLEATSAIKQITLTVNKTSAISAQSL